MPSLNSASNNFFYNCRCEISTHQMHIYGWHGIFVYVINSIVMGNLLYIIAVVLVIIWAIGFLGFQAGGIIHLLLVIAIVAILLRVIQGRKPL